MLDTTVRRHLDGPLRRSGHWLSERGVPPLAVTAVGFAAGIAACVAVAADRWPLAILCWLLNRLADGLDGPLARATEPTDVGGFLDIMADFAVYGGIVVALGVAVPDARMAALAVFLAYYLSGSAFLAWSSLAAARSRTGDGRSLHFPGGLAEGTETIVAYVIILALPGRTAVLLWIWAAVVGVTALQRVVFVVRSLRTPSRPTTAREARETGEEAG